MIINENGVEREPTAADYQSLGFTLENGVWTPPAPVAKPYRISKADIWRRTTDDEADLLRATLSQTSVRLQGIFDGAQFISTDDDFYQMLRAGVVLALGEERTAVVLAPSEM